MINLLPSQAKESARREYRMRVSVVVLVFGSVLCAAGVFLLAPSYFFARENMRSSAEHIEYEKNLALAAGESDRMIVVREVNRKLSILSRGFARSMSVKDMAARILAARPESVRLFALSVDISATPARATLSGVADDRAALSLFIRALESDSAFQSVEIPISQFVEERNIEWSMRVAISPSFQKEASIP